jgi:hypothetical protein
MIRPRGRFQGEIDITRPRWIEKPATVVRMFLGNVKAFEAGAGTERFEEGRQEAAAKPWADPTSPPSCLTAAPTMFPSSSAHTTVTSPS